MGIFRIIAKGHPAGLTGCLAYEAHGQERICADETLIRMFACEDYGDFYQHTGGSFRTMGHPEDIQRVEWEITSQIHDSDDSLDRVEHRILRKDGEVRMVDDIDRCDVVWKLDRFARSRFGETSYFCGIGCTSFASVGEIVSSVDAVDDSDSVCVIVSEGDSAWDV